MFMTIQGVNDDDEDTDYKVEKLSDSNFKITNV